MKATYLAKLSHPEWQKKRLTILQRDDWTCQLCGDKTTTLHVHHNKYTTNLPWNAPDSDLITYCEVCHSVAQEYSIHKIIKVIKNHTKVPNESLVFILSYYEDTKIAFITIVTYNHSKKCFVMGDKVAFIFQWEFDIVTQLIQLTKNG